MSRATSSSRCQVLWIRKAGSCARRNVVIFNKLHAHTRTKQSEGRFSRYPCIGLLRLNPVPLYVRTYSYFANALASINLVPGHGRVSRQRPFAPTLQQRQCRGTVNPGPDVAVAELTVHHRWAREHERCMRQWKA